MTCTPPCSGADRSSPMKLVGSSRRRASGSRVVAMVTALSYAGVGRKRRRSGPPDVIRARPRTQHELLAWLEGCPVSTLSALRRQRFTLRLISSAERDGLVAVDERTGHVALVAR